MSERQDLTGWLTERTAALHAVMARGEAPSRRRLAAELGISPRTMRARDQRVGVVHVVQSTTAAVPHTHLCRGCLTPIPCRTGNHRRWCTAGCRLAAYRLDHAAKPEALVCACGATYSYRRGRGRRPSTCPTCRAVAVLTKAATKAAAILAVGR